VYFPLLWALRKKYSE
jgi:hypothetical protein